MNAHVVSLAAARDGVRGGRVPPAAWADMALAAQRVAELAAAGCELHFRRDAAAGLVVELRDLEGALLRELTPAQALDALSAPPRNGDLPSGTPSG